MSLRERADGLDSARPEHQTGNRINVDFGSDEARKIFSDSRHKNHDDKHCGNKSEHSKGSEHESRDHLNIDYDIFGSDSRLRQINKNVRDVETNVGKSFFETIKDDKDINFKKLSHDLKDAAGDSSRTARHLDRVDDGNENLENATDSARRASKNLRDACQLAKQLDDVTGDGKTPPKEMLRKLQEKLMRAEFDLFDTNLNLFMNDFDKLRSKGSLPSNNRTPREPAENPRQPSDVPRQPSNTPRQPSGQPSDVPRQPSDLPRQPGGSVNYDYVPPAQRVGGGSGTQEVKPGYIFGPTWQNGGSSELKGIYPAPQNGWEPLVWRWKDTLRQDAITSGIGPGGVPSYKFEVKAGDGPSPGTHANPRAELFSIDPSEKRGQRPAPQDNIVKNGDEYWMTFGTYIPEDFSQNQKWATLFQRKQADGTTDPPPWGSISVHGKYIDFNFPHAPTNDGGAEAARVARIPIDEIKGKWVQFTVHEKARADSSGLWEVYMGDKKLGQHQGPTVRDGVNYHIQYGYYRDANVPKDDRVYETPIMIYRGAKPPEIPKLTEPR